MKIPIPTMSVAAGLACLCTGATQTVTQTVSASVAPAAKISVPASASLLYNGGSFLDFTGAFTLSYKARTGTSTSVSAGMRVSTDFTPSGGPSAAAGHLTYTCGSATLGTGCTGATTASTAASQTVLTLPALACTGGGSPCSTAEPNTVQLQFQLRNLPSFATGAYSGQLLFTISAL